MNHKSSVSTGISRTTVVIVAALALLGASSVFTVASAHPGAAADSPHPLGFVQNSQAAAAPQVALSGGLPASVDLSADNPPVGDQGGVDSCVAWSTAYYLRSWYAKRDGYYPAGSFAPMFTYTQLVHGVNRGTFFGDNLNIQRQQGVDAVTDYTQGNYDYTSPPSDAERTNAARYKIASYQDYVNPGGTGLQNWIEATLSGGNPIAIGIPVYPEFDNVSAASNWLVGTPTSGETSRGGHAVFAYGYDQNGLWIENSWGTGWGKAGFAELSWVFVNQYGGEVVSITPQRATLDWLQLPGGATDIAVNRYGSVWVVGSNAVPGGYGIFRWDSTTWSWSAFPGGAVHIAVPSNGNPWVVNSSGTIFQWAGWGWQAMPGTARDIGIGANDSIWIIGTNAVSGGNGIFHWNGSGWDAVSGGAVRIAVDPNGNPWAVNSFGDIFRWTGSSWQQIPGSATDIGIGANGVVWTVCTNPVPGGYGISRWTGNSWADVAGGAVAISVGPSGNAWTAAGDDTIWESIG